jgi:hypothetical protein
VVEALNLPQLMHCNLANINRDRELKVVVRLDDLTMVEDLVCE